MESFPKSGFLDEESIRRMTLVDKLILSVTLVIMRSLLLIGVLGQNWQVQELPEKYTDYLFKDLLRSPMPVGDAIVYAMIKVKLTTGKDSSDPANWIKLDEAQQRYLNQLNANLWNLITRDLDPLSHQFY